MSVTGDPEGDPVKCGVPVADLSAGLLCAVLDRQDLFEDPRFATNADRNANRAELAAEPEGSLSARDTEEWVDLLLDAGAPAGQIRDYQPSCEDPHTLVREMVVELDHPVAGPVRALGIPVKLSETAGTIRRAPPQLGQHTDEILHAVGYSPDYVVGLLSVHCPRSSSDRSDVRVRMRSVRGSS